MRPPLDAPDSPDGIFALADAPCVSADPGAAPTAPDAVVRDFRDALSSFATGVTVLTARAPDGEPVGVTISSFNSVSLQPPLILWSLACDSPRIDAFRRASHYAVNVLAADQEWVSDLFASRVDDRFGRVAVSPGIAGVPLIDGCAASFECTSEAHYAGGDHLIFLGRVQRFVRADAAQPLIFHAGRYRKLHDDAGQ